MCEGCLKRVYGDKALKDAKRTIEDKDIIDDLIKGRVYWVGEPKPDYWSNLKNSNVIISMFLVHPLHPLGKFGRRVIFLANIFTSLFVAGIIAQISDNMSQRCNLLTGTSLTLCQGENSAELHGYSFVLGIACSIWMSFLAFFANCQWASKKSAGIRLIVNSIGNFYLYIGLFVSLLWGIGGILLGIYLPLGTTQFFLSFLYSQLSSWASDIILGSGSFAWAWYKQRRAIRKGKSPFKWDSSKDYAMLQEDADRTLAEALQNRVAAVQEAKDKVVQSVDTAVQKKVDLVNNTVASSLEKIKVATSPKSKAEVSVEIGSAEPAVAALDTTRSLDIASTETQLPSDSPKSSPTAKERVAEGVHNAKAKLADGIGKYIPSPKAKHQLTDADAAAAIP